MILPRHASDDTDDSEVGLLPFIYPLITAFVISHAHSQHKLRLYRDHELIHRASSNCCMHNCDIVYLTFGMSISASINQGSFPEQRSR